MGRVLGFALGVSVTAYTLIVWKAGLPRLSSFPFEGAIAVVVAVIDGLGAVLDIAFLPFLLISAAVLGAFATRALFRLAQRPADLPVESPAEDALTQVVAPDRPALDDELGTKEIAISLADQVLATTGGPGITFGIEGKWGSGKSTVLGFMIQELEHREYRRPMKSPLIVNFNPWWFSGVDDLRLQFINEIRAQLTPRKRWIAVTSRVLASLRIFSESIPLPQAVVASSLTRFVESLVRPRGAGANELRERLTRDLVRSGRPVIIIVDDIDRLTPDETRPMLSLLKSVSELPLTSLVMAYDREVMDSLTSDWSGDQSFVEKIIHVPVTMPSIDSSRMHRWLIDQLDLLIEDVDQDFLWDSHLWLRGVFPALRELIETPRDVRRYLNALGTAYPPLRHEVNATDFFALQAVATFVPAVFARLGVARRLLTGGSDVLVNSHSDEAAKARLSEIIDAAPVGKRQPVRALLKALFSEAERLLPPPTSIRTGRSRGEEFAQRRASDPVLIDLYFQRSMGITAAPRQYVLKFLQRGRGDLARELRDADRGDDTGLDRVLDELRSVVGTRASQLQLDRRELLLGISDVSDEFWRPYAEPVAVRNYDRLAFLSHDLVESGDESLDYAAYLREASSLAIITRVHWLLRERNERFRSSDAILAERLADSMVDGSFSTMPRPVTLIYSLRDLTGDEFRPGIIDNALRDPVRLQEFVLRALRWVWSAGGVDIIQMNVDVLADVGLSVAQYQETARAILADGTSISLAHTRALELLLDPELLLLQGEMLDLIRPIFEPAE